MLTPANPIPNWHPDQRPREKLALRGASSLSDAELLAIFIRTGVKGKTAVDLAADLLRKHGGLRQILNANPRDLNQFPGLGPAKCALLQAALELGNRYLAQKLHREGPLTSPTEAGEFLTHQLRDRAREVFAVVYLDTRHYVLHYDELFHGTVNGATVHPREVVKSALQHNAAAVIIAHNHPSGIAEPSHADASLTTRIQAALNLVDVRLLDHLVIGDGEFVSMNERGLF